jgi:hypothetical protein
MVHTPADSEVDVAASQPSGRRWIAAALAGVVVTFMAGGTSRPVGNGGKPGCRRRTHAAVSSIRRTKGR